MVDRVGEMAAVILCGGESRRMGRDKAMLAVDGRPLVVAVAERVAQAADPVMLAPGVPGRLGPMPFPEVADGLIGAGPLGGMAAGIAASPHQLTAVVAVDMPNASAAVLSFLADVVVAADVDAAIPVTSEGEQYLHAVYARSALPHISIAL